MSRKKNTTQGARPPATDQAPAHSGAQTTTSHPPAANTADHRPPGNTTTPEADGAHTPPTGTPATPGQATTAKVPNTPAREYAHDDVEQAPTPPSDEHEQHHGPMWSASEAARRCGIGRATMTRKLQAGDIAGATRDEDGHWRIPLSGLLAAGLRPDRPAATEAPSPQDDGTADVDHIAAAVELAELRGQLAVERARREAAEQLANERAARIEDLRHALRAIEPPAPPAQEEKPQVKTPVQAAQEPDQPSSPQPEGVAGRLRRWWKGH